MSAAYWAQWSHAELMSMQGVELEDYHDVDIDDMIDDEEEEKEEGCPCGSHCMDCLGLSWRDFMQNAKPLKTKGSKSWKTL